MQNVVTQRSTLCQQPYWCTPSLPWRPELSTTSEWINLMRGKTMDPLCYIVSQPFPILFVAGPTRGEGVGSRATSFSALPQSIRYGLFCAPCNIALNHCVSGHARRRTVCVAVRPCASSSTLHLSGDRVLRVGFLPYEPRARSLL